MLARLRKSAVAAAALAALLAHGNAAADVVFSGSGSWAADAPFTLLSAPNATWSLAFALPSSPGSTATSAISGFSYKLGGVSIGASPSVVTFFTAADGGMFDLAFTGSSPSFSLYGDAVLAGGSLLPGSYAVYAGISGGQAVGAGTLALAPVPVPEPATWATCALGLAGLVSWSRRRRSGAATTQGA